MAPLSLLNISTLTPTPFTTSPPTQIQPSNVPTLYIPDTKARNAVIFGVIATVLTIIGIIIAGATLWIAQQARPADTPQGSNNTSVTDQEMEMESVEDTQTLSQTSTVASAAEEDEL